MRLKELSMQAKQAILKSLPNLAKRLVRGNIGSKGLGKSAKQVRSVRRGRVIRENVSGSMYTK